MLSYKGVMNKARQIEEPKFTEWHKEPFTLAQCMAQAPDVFEQGEVDCERFILSGEPQDHKTNEEFCNPYPEGTVQFYCWNRGWNHQMGKEISKVGLNRHLTTLFGPKKTKSVGKQGIYF